MLGCTSSFSVANVWHAMMKVLFKPPPDEVRKRAKCELTAAIKNLQYSEDELRADIRAIAGEVKRAQKTQVQSNMMGLLNSSRQKRQRLGSILKQRIALQNQHEALNSVELNQKVMSSIKQTSSALKALGLDNQLNDIDETMLDLKESNEDVSLITDALQQNLALGGDSVQDDDLQDELAILLCEDDDPANVLSMQTSAVGRPSTVAAPAVQNSTTDTAADMHATTEEEGAEQPISVENKQAVHA